MSGFTGPEKFTLLVSVDAPPWVSRDVRSVLCRMPGLTDEERKNVFSNRERAVSVGVRVIGGNRDMDSEWLSVAPLASFSFG